MATINYKDPATNQWVEFLVGVTIDSSLSNTSANPVQNKVINSALNGKYTKPTTGIPKTDLDSDVQTSLEKADSAIQKPSTPTTESAIIINSSGAISTEPLTSIGGGGVQFVELFPGSTLTPAQLTILKANKGNQIIYYGGVLYYFKLAYEKSSNEWLYVTFYDSAVTLTVNMTTGSATFDASGKLYLHSLLFEACGIPGVNSGGKIDVLVERYSSSSTPLTSSNFQTLFPTDKVVVGTAYLNNGDAICTIRCAQTGEILQAILCYP